MHTCEMDFLEKRPKRPLGEIPHATLYGGVENKRPKRPAMLPSCFMRGHLLPISAGTQHRNIRAYSCLSA